MADITAPGERIELIDVTDAAGRVSRPDVLARAEPVHRELRTFDEPYADVLARVFAGGGRMRVATRGGDVVGVAIYRVFENTYAARQLFVDDLVTAAAHRSGGVGAALLGSLESTARDAGCATLALDSGTSRDRAHAFYFREGLAISSYHFSKRVT